MMLIDNIIREFNKQHMMNNGPKNQIPKPEVPANNGTQQQQQQKKDSYVVVNGLKIELNTYNRLNDFATISGRKVNRVINFAIKRFLSDLPHYDKALLNAIKNRRGMTEVVVEPKTKDDTNIPVKIS